MTPDTRKRLLELWEKVPELRPIGLDYDGEWSVGAGGEPAHDDLAESAAVGKLCEWLADCGERRQSLRELTLASNWGSMSKKWAAISNGRGVSGYGSVLDALIAAAEAVAKETPA